MRFQKRAKASLLAGLIVLFALNVPLISQTSANGSVHGRVVDGSGAAIVGVSLLAHSPSVGGSFRAVTDAEGNYRLTQLPTADDYVVEAESSGFEKFVRSGLIIRAGLNVTVDITLNIGSQSQSVEVSGEAPLIDTQNAEQAVNLSGELLRNVPITGRHDWSDSLQLTPGIVSASADAQGGQTYFLRGSENENHATLVDGMDVGSFQQNWPSNGISISNESLGDIQIKTGANDASSPAAMGMVINMSSPTGSDRYHGSFLWLLGPEALNANNANGGTSAVTSTQQPDFSLGGPIKRQRAWFFASGRYINRDDGISQTATQLGYLNGIQPGFNAFANHSSGFIFLGNASVQLNDRHRLMALIQYDSRKQDANYQWYAANIAHNQYGGGAYGLRLISQWSQNLTTRFLISFNNKGSNSSADAIGGVGSKPEIDLYASNTLSSGRLVGQGSSVATLNNLSSITLNPANKTTITGDVNYYIGKGFGSHEIQAGFYLEPTERSKTTTLYANAGTNIQQDAVLNNPNDPSKGYTIFHTQSVDRGSLVSRYITANDYAFYLQDRWRPFSRLSITVGVRPDWISGRDALFKVTTQNSWNVAPRVGGAFVLTKNQRNVIRASWSKITDITNASYLGAAGSSTVTTTDTYYLPSGPATFVTPGSTALSADRVFDSDRHQGFVREWLVGYRTQLPGAIVVDASYIDREYRDRPALVDNNQIYSSTTTGVTWSGLNNPAFNNFYLVTNNKWNWFVYQGYEVTVTKQTKAVQLFSTYSYSPDHLAGAFQPNDPAAILEPTKFANNAGLGSVRGNVTNDYTGDTRNRMWQRQQWRTGVTWRAPWKIRFSNTVTAQSGTAGGPVVVTQAYNGQYGPATRTINGRTVSNPLAVAYRFKYGDRGIGQIFTPWLVQWNTLIGREFPITDRQGFEIAANIYNVTNRGAGQQFVNGTNASSSTFGSLQNIQTPRSAQFTLRYHF
ncbi:TonB-dependent receptor [Terriglobus sp. 2YAB30_2]|uniref:TonB-dependent receptor domain-containing protein n=1 Tax=unclassified Terriglobus TaxID=2628988 RepID=UPI003F986BD9